MHPVKNSQTIERLPAWQRISSVLLAMALLFSGLSLSVAPVRAEGDAVEGLAAGVICQSYHTVKRGETLYKIGLMYDMVWTKIAEANNISNPNRIYTGQVLCIPADSTHGASQVLQVQKYDVNIRKGPGMQYKILGILRSYQTIQVTGKSLDGYWWRVLCLDGKVGECYVTANPKYTKLITVTDDEEPAPTPTFSISAVVEDTSVTISTLNFPKNRDFVVRMGLYGTRGINGEYITTVNSGAGGKLAYTFAIPEKLRDRARIAIRLESASGYYAYNWFWNATAQ